MPDRPRIRAHGQAGAARSRDSSRPGRPTGSPGCGNSLFTISPIEFPRPGPWKPTQRASSASRPKPHPHSIAGGAHAERRAKRAWLVATASSAKDAPPAWLAALAGERDAVYVCEPRGIGGSRWTQKSPPNYVARSHFLLGRTVDSGRVWDLAAAARYVRTLHQEQTQVFWRAKARQRSGQFMRPCSSRTLAG